MYAYTEIDMSYIDTCDLIDELNTRKAPVALYSNLQVDAIIGRLQQLGCPEHIIEQLQEWARQPVANSLKLQQWKQLCGV